MNTFSQIQNKRNMNINQIWEAYIKTQNMSEPYEELGGGSQGIAYKVGDKVYKITQDESEYASSKRLIGINTKFINRIYKVKILNAYHRRYFLIIQDYVTPLSEHTKFKDYRSIFDLMASYGRSYLRAHRDNRFEEKINQAQNIVNHVEKIKGIIGYENIPYSYVSALDEMIHNGFKNTDACFANLGIKDNHIVIFDLGYSLEHLFINEDEVIDVTNV